MKNGKPINIFKIIIAVGFFGIIAYTISKNINNKFWDTNIIQVLSLINAVVIGFFIVQSLTEKRRYIDCIDKIVLDLQKEVANNEDIYSSDKRIARLAQKSVSNRIKYLKDYSDGEVKKEFEYIENQMKEFKEMYDDHCGSDEEIKGIRVDLNRYIDNITDKCVKIRLMLYKI